MCSWIIQFTSGIKDRVTLISCHRSRFIIRITSNYNSLSSMNSGNITFVSSKYMFFTVNILKVFNIYINSYSLSPGSAK